MWIMNREDILERLNKMDMEAFATIDDENMYQIVIVGGSGLVLLGTISRATQDASRPVDRQDLISDEVLRNVNWSRLKHLALDDDEAKASALNERSYQDFLFNYYEYVRRYGPHEDTDI